MSAIRSKLSRWSRDFGKALESLDGGSAIGRKLTVARAENDPALCSYCAGITWDKLCGSYLHQPDYWALKESGEYCPLCRVLVASLQVEDDGNPAVRESDLQELDTTISLEGARMPDGDGWEDQLFLKCGQRMKSLDVWVDRGRGDQGPRRGIAAKADSEENFEWLRKTVQTCVSSHKGCTLGGAEDGKFREDPLQKLPTRVLDVGPADGSQPVKLIETQRRPGKYVALSHCWGKKQIIRTLKDTVGEDGKLVKGTLEQHYKEIPFHSLSKTFQDAVVIARKLDMRYLWIDSLAIIQNDAEDWAKEAAYMGDVYKFATFNIMAAGAEAGAMGCFMARSRPTLEPVKVRCIGRDGKPESVQIGLPKGSLRDGLDNGPLQSRAWCLQERVLSRRSIHFCARQIVYECQTTSVAEDDTRLDGLNGSVEMEAYQMKLHDNRGAGAHLRNPLQARWRRIVQDYTHRDLTKTTDKLPAISGLAQKVQEESGDQYAAGLWRDHIHNDLFWFAVEPMEPAVPYRAPSWSWAAYDGPVSYGEVFDMKTMYYNSTLKDVQVSTHPTTANVNGEVDAGELRFKGRIRKAIYSATRAPKGNDPTKHSKQLFQEDRSEVGQYGLMLGFGALDAACDEERVVECLSLGVRPFPPAPFHMVLLVAPTGADEGEYRRIGAALIRPEPWFDGVPYQRIKLV